MGPPCVSWPPKSGAAIRARVRSPQWTHVNPTDYRMRFEDPRVCYLSGSQTTVRGEDRPDEAIHLASAMQFVGFRSVIGMMWAVDDGETNKITPTFCKHMVDESGRLDHTPQHSR